jgi:hypothetical protein
MSANDQVQSEFPAPISEDPNIMNARLLLEETLAKIDREAVRFSRRANYERRNHYILNYMIMILSVLAPIMVTLQTQLDGTAWKVIAVVITALAGASATLQASFRWRERYRLTRMTALELEDLSSNTRAEQYRAYMNSTDQESFDQLVEINRRTRGTLSKVFRDYFHAETNIGDERRNER